MQMSLIPQILLMKKMDLWNDDVKSVLFLSSHFLSSWIWTTNKFDSNDRCQPQWGVEKSEDLVTGLMTEGLTSNCSPSG